MNLQDNIKIKLGKITEETVRYSVNDKSSGEIITDRVIDKKSVDLDDIAIDCQEDYCEWYRKGGRNVLRDYYEK